MVIRLFLTLEGLNYYGDIPEVPSDRTDCMEEISLNNDDIELFCKDIDSLNSACNSTLDKGDVDFFDVQKCMHLRRWIAQRMTLPLSVRYETILIKLDEYCQRAIELKTGVVIEL